MGSPRALPRVRLPAAESLGFAGTVVAEDSDLCCAHLAILADHERSVLRARERSAGDAARERLGGQRRIDNAFAGRDPADGVGELF